MIEKARKRGSLPRGIAAELYDAISGERLAFICGHVDETLPMADGQVQLVVGDEWETPTRLFKADLVVLATGFERSRTGGKWLDRAVREFALSCHACGYQS